MFPLVWHERQKPTNTFVKNYKATFTFVFSLRKKWIEGEFVFCNSVLVV